MPKVTNHLSTLNSHRAHKKNPQPRPMKRMRSWGIYCFLTARQRLAYFFFHRRVMSSSVLPLVSGTSLQTKMAAMTQMMP